MTSMHVPEAVISLAVAPKDKGTVANFSKALNRFTKEDPTFRVHRDEESAQTIISGMGELHLEIYIERMKREYACEVIAGKPQVAYRETLNQRGRIQLHPQEADRRQRPIRPARPEFLLTSGKIRFTSTLAKRRAQKWWPRSFQTTK